MARYAELHCHSGFSFLDGACDPEELAADRRPPGPRGPRPHRPPRPLRGRALRRGRPRAFGLATVFGAELTLGGRRPRAACPTPSGEHLVVLARDAEGYAALSRRCSPRRTCGGGAKGGAALQPRGPGARARTSGWCSTGCRKGPLDAQRCIERGARAPRGAARPARSRPSGASNVAVEIWDHGAPDDVGAQRRAGRAGRRTPTWRWWRPTTSTTPRPTPSRGPTSLSAIRARRSLEEMEGWLSASPLAHLRSDAEQRRRFARWPGRGRPAGELGARAGLRPAPRRAEPAAVPDARRDGRAGLPRARSSSEGATQRYGRATPSACRARGARSTTSSSVIGALGFAGYFLIVWDITEFCRRTTSTARAAARRRTRRSATRSGSPTPTRCGSTCSSSASSRRRATARPTSTSTSSRAGARR